MLISELPTQPGARAEGRFTVTAPPTPTRGYPDIHAMTICDASGSVECLYRPALPNTEWLSPSMGEGVFAHLNRAENRFGVAYWRIERLIPLHMEAIMQGIPCEQCPKPQWISALGHLIHRRIHSETVVGFLQSVFNQREIMEPFLRFGASSYVHHCEPGGLFEHSVKAAVQLAEITDEATAPLERDCCIAGMLFHDIGKIAPAFSKTGLLRSKDHPFLIGMILSDALDMLRLVDRPAWEIMHYVFGVIAGTYDDSRIPLTKFIGTVDQYHAAEDVRERVRGQATSQKGSVNAPTGQVYFQNAPAGK